MATKTQTDDMKGGFIMDKNEYFKMLASKLSLTTEEINKEFEEILKDEKEIHSSLPLEQQEMRSLKRLALAYKKQMRSPAVGFEGVIFATSDCVDIIAKKRREAIELFKKDPQAAVTQGVTDENGAPLDTTEIWSTGRQNPNFGKPLSEHNYLKNIWGIAKKQKDANSQPKFFQMLLTGSQATENIPIFQSLMFQAIDKGEADGVLKLNPSSFTKFVEGNFEVPELASIVKNYIPSAKIGELRNYHELNKDGFNRIVAVEADVSMMMLEPTSVGSRIITLEDDSSLEDFDANGLTCWVPERINLDFAEGSKIIVLGRTAQGFKRDEEGNQTEELGDVTLNVFGIYVLPEFKIELPKELEDISEEELE